MEFIIFLLIIRLPFGFFIEFGQINDHQNWQNDRFWNLEEQWALEAEQDYWNFQNQQNDDGIWQNKLPDIQMQEIQQNGHNFEMHPTENPHSQNPIFDDFQNVPNPNREIIVEKTPIFDGNPTFQSLQPVQNAASKSQQLQNAGLNSQWLQHIGSDLRQLQQADFEMQRLKDADVSMQRNLEQRLQGLQHAGPRLLSFENTEENASLNSQLLQDSIPGLQPLQDAGPRLLSFQHAKENSQRWKNARPSSQLLNDAGSSWLNFQNTGSNSQRQLDREPSAQRLHNAVPNSQQLQNLGPNSQRQHEILLSSQRLQDAGSSSQRLQDAGPSLQPLQDAYSSLKELKDPGPNLMRLWQAVPELRKLLDEIPRFDSVQEFSDEQAKQITKIFFKLRKKFWNICQDSEFLCAIREIDDKIAQKMGIPLEMIHQWGKKFGLGETKRLYSSEYKQAIVREYVDMQRKGKMTKKSQGEIVRKIATKYDIHQTTLDQWKRELLGENAEPRKYTEQQKREIVTRFLRESAMIPSCVKSRDRHKMEREIANRLDAPRIAISHWKIKLHGASKVAKKARKFTEEDKKNILKEYYRMKAQSIMTDKQIAKHLGIDACLLWRWKKKYGKQ